MPITCPLDPCLEVDYGGTTHQFCSTTITNALDNGNWIARKKWGHNHEFVYKTTLPNGATTCHHTTDGPRRLYVDLTVLIKKTSGDKLSPNWSPSQEDMLADDWYVLTSTIMAQLGDGV